MRRHGSGFAEPGWTSWHGRAVRLAAILLPMLAGGCPAAVEPVTRADLAQSFVELERAYFSAARQAAEAASVNRRFDGATRAFFGFQFALGVARMDATTSGLTGESPAARWARSLAVRPEPVVWHAGLADRLSARIGPLYSPDGENSAAPELRLTLIDENGAEHGSADLGMASTSGGVVAFSVLPSALPVGRYSLALVTKSGEQIERATLFISAFSFDRRRRELLARLDGLGPRAAGLARPIASVRARIELLDDTPGLESSARFRADLLRLADEVTAEVAALEQGRNPLFQKAGEYWRVVGEGGDRTPVRIYAPTTVNDGGLRPLIIALHGAGADEQIFSEAYGAGRLRTLVEARNVIVAAPETTAFLTDASRMGKLLDSLRADYAVDPARTYLLGHSLGAVAVVQSLRFEPGVFAAAVCFSGGVGLADVEDVPPTRVIIGPLDEISPPDRNRTAAREAVAAGKPVELLEIANYGHTLVVGQELERAFDWLLARTRRAAETRPMPRP